MRLSASAILAGLAAAASVNAQAACGRNNYTSDEIEDASDEACKLFKRGSQVGRNNYPHRYNNFEGFEFKGYDGPFQEFPIVSGRVFDGRSSPGPDRVIITEHCEEAGVITHSGARGNSFVACEASDDDDNDDDDDDDNDRDNSDEDDEDDSSATRFTAASLWVSLAVGAAAYLI